MNCLFIKKSHSTCVSCMNGKSWDVHPSPTGYRLDQGEKTKPRWHHLWKLSQFVIAIKILQLPNSASNLGIHGGSVNLQKAHSSAYHCHTLNKLDVQFFIINLLTVQYCSVWKKLLQCAPPPPFLFFFLKAPSPFYIHSFVQSLYVLLCRVCHYMTICLSKWAVFCSHRELDLISCIN